MKKLLLIMLGALLVLPSVARDFTYTYKGQTLTYTVLDEDVKTVKIVRNTSVEGELIIPSIAKDGDTEYSVTSIGDYAFYRCSGLTSIVIPNSVTSIRYAAFCECSGLTSIVIPNSVTSIGRLAFCGCSGLTSIVIPNSVTSIGDEAFSGCSGLTSIVIPNSVTSIGERAFYGCSGLTSIVIPNSVTSIGDWAFYGCSGLTSIVIPNSVTSIGRLAFCGCSGLTSIVIPNSVTSIGDSAFRGCSGLTTIDIPDSVTSIGDCAFMECSGLTSIVIPNSVTSIGNSAFSYCSGLAAIEVSPENPNYSSVDGVLFNKDLSIIIQFPAGMSGDYVIPNSVTSIVERAFSGCSGLTSIDIPTSVTSIGDGAFSGCSGLTSIVIPNSVTSIGYLPLYGCSSLTSIEVSPQNPNYSSVDGVLFNKDLTLIIQFPAGMTGDYVIPNSVTSIGFLTFSYCSGLTSIVIPNSVTSIGERAFSGCSGLTSIVIPNSVTSIRYEAFYECSGLKSVYYGADEPIEADGWAFNETIYESATLYMTEKGAKKGRAIYPWMNFKNIAVYDPAGIEDAAAEFDTDKPCEVYSLSGVRVGDSTLGLAPGIYVARQGKAVKKITVR